MAGMRAELVTIEAQFRPGDRNGTEVLITGLPDPVIRESRAKLVCALQENRLRLRPGRLHINLIPAARPKSGSMLDLPLALAAAAAAGHLPAEALTGSLFLGELGIDGSLYDVCGGLASAITAHGEGVKRLVSPPATAHEAACLQDLAAHHASHLPRPTMPRSCLAATHVLMLPAEEA